MLLWRQPNERRVMTPKEHAEWLASLSPAAIDHAYAEYREWAGESERDAAVRDTNAVLERRSAR
jgi:hypothetical protein